MKDINDIDFKVGEAYEILKGPGKPYKIHILTIVDECQIVYKWYGRHKQWWHYEIASAELLTIQIMRTKELNEKEQLKWQTQR